MIIERQAEHILQQYAQAYPVIALMGPRQSGKTTLATRIFPDYEYVSLEDVDLRETVKSDPRRFLDRWQAAQGVIIDEIQHVPELLSYMQTIVDQHKRPGFFIVIGSQNLLFGKSITQTLAGRMALLTLLPLSVRELRDNNLLTVSADAMIFKGGYPVLYNTPAPPNWARFYTEQYVERDIHQLQQVHDLSTFRRFMRLCAGRVGQLLNIASLSRDCAISQKTARAWLALLEATYVVFLAQPYFNNVNKRLVKAPKLYFYDTGLLCSLLRISSAETLNTHFNYGGIFESFVLSELMKGYCNRGYALMPHFYRDSSGAEVDCVLEENGRLYPIEIKSSMTDHRAFFKGLEYFQNLTHAHAAHSYIVYAGAKYFDQSHGRVISWSHVDDIAHDVLGDYIQ